jgi:GTP cyclohydrolase I
MNAPEPVLPDVQASTDTRNIAISRVGIRGLRHPVNLAGPNGPVAGVATIDMFVALPGDRKGTHMSRFLDVLRESREALSLPALRSLLERMLGVLGAQEGGIELRLPYFINKAAPVSGIEGLVDYDLALSGTLEGGRLRLRQTVVVPVTSLCPCSKEISAYGAHNQRSHVTIAIESAQAFAIEEQVRIAEDAASCELWSALKRADEKWVTERAYDNPKFVEDVVRDIAAVLERDARVHAYRVESENFESIHNHSAFARIERDKRA